MNDLKTPELFRSCSFINGQWLSSDKTFSVINPATNETIANIAEVTNEQVLTAIEGAESAQLMWQSKTSFQRADILHKWANLIFEHRNDLALLMTREQGKTLADAKGEVLYGMSFIDWFAEEGKRVYGDTVINHDNNKQIEIIKQPVGVVGAITPWNFPNAMITRKAAAALAAGCCFVVKPAAETPLSALALAYLAKQAGLPDGVLNVVIGENAPAIGELLTTHPAIKKFTFTGSTNVGKLLSQQCASSVKKISMELGGNAPFIVFDDADIDLAVNQLTTAKLRNCGQTCISPNRIYLHRSIYEIFSKKLLEKLAGVKQGNGEEKANNIGCLIHNKAALNVHHLVTKAVEQGATAMLGGLPQAPKDSFYPLTVLTDVKHGDDITRHEIFGPVVSLIAFDDESEVVKQANDTEFGLAAYFFAKDISRVKRVATQLEYGMVGVNETAISSTISPFGGVKHSGFGKEGSKYGLDDYLTIKAVTLSY